MIVFGDGTQTRDFTYVSDTARGIMAAGMADTSVGETLNLGYGSEIAINDLAAEVALAGGRSDAAVIHSEPRPGDVLRLCADRSKARSLCGYEPRIGLNKGLSLLKSWYVSLGTPPEVLLEQEIVRNWEASPAHA
jgi:UDP-glucose 4-epimerase